MCHLSSGSGAVSARGPESWQEALYFWNNHDKWEEKSVGESLLRFRNVIFLILICMLSIVSSILFPLQPLDTCVWCRQQRRRTSGRSGWDTSGRPWISLPPRPPSLRTHSKIWIYNHIPANFLSFVFFWPFTFSAPQTWCVWAARKTT